MNACLTERRPPWVMIAGRDDPWSAAKTAELRTRGGEMIRLDGRQLSNPEAMFAAFAPAVASGMDVRVALYGERLMVILGGEDWPVPRVPPRTRPEV